MRSICAVLAAGMLAATTPAAAQTAPVDPGTRGGPEMGGGPGMSGRAMQWFQAMDADKNGSISTQEFMAAHGAAAGRFSALDTNGDGTLTREEFMADGGPRRAERFAEIDRNKDGRVSEAEVDAYTGDMFSMMDSNGDGQLSQSEFGPGRMRQR